MSTPSSTPQRTSGPADRKNKPEYFVWLGMRRRCRGQKEKCYPHYGGRGIRVCERWDKSFDAFYADMGPRPSPKHSVDRIDNDGNYEPGNCRWATNREQCNNTRVNRVIKYNGLRLTAKQWAARTGLRFTTILFRLNRGWSAEEILTKSLASASEAAALAAGTRKKHPPKLYWHTDSRRWCITIRVDGKQKRIKFSADKTEAEAMRQKWLAENWMG